jgi:formylglycine-generating enzyme required for sulfatase activity
MTISRVRLPIAMLLLLAGISHGQDPRKDSAESVDALVRQLGDDRFARREQAGKELEAIGEKALPALRVALSDSPDPEVQVRARKTVLIILQGLKKSKSLGLELAPIDAGEFEMGSPKAEIGRRPDEQQHPARVTQPFLLGAYEVTQGQYRQVMEASPSWFSPTGEGKIKIPDRNTDRYPVERVTWYDAAEFCNRLSKADGYPAFYKLGDVEKDGQSIKAAKVEISGGAGYRLPTEAEWEYACRAKTLTPFHFGPKSTGLEANVKAMPPTGYGDPPKKPDLLRTCPVGSYKPNEFGLYDMHGNVAEWCQDWYGRDYYDKCPERDPPGPAEGTHRVARGGSWLVSYGSCRSASRLLVVPEDKNYAIGFRVARTP